MGSGEWEVLNSLRLSVSPSLHPSVSPPHCLTVSHSPPSLKSTIMEDFM